MLDKQKLTDWMNELVLGFFPRSYQLGHCLQSLDINSSECVISLSLPFPAKGIQEQLVESIKQLVEEKEPGLKQVSVQVKSRVIAYETKAGVPPLAKVKNIIAVASGKGGVGKSTTSVNLALALAEEGAKVGILDADIYGPSVPIMLGIASSRPVSEDKKTILPLEAHGIESMSIGFLIEENQSMVWRGPMASSALQQIVRDTRWGELDYLIIDLPPGTGDIQLTMAQKIPVTAAIIVTTPQDLALADAKKAVSMFEKVKIPVMGIVENMSTHTCSQCGYSEAIFGAGGGESMSKEYKIPLLGQLPLVMSIREELDKGTPALSVDPESIISQTYRQIARNLAANLTSLGKDYSKGVDAISVKSWNPGS